MYTALSQTNTTDQITVEGILSTIVFTTLGIVIMVVALVIINVLFRLNMHHELVEENNTAYGIMIGGVSIAIALIVAGTILS